MKSAYRTRKKIWIRGTGRDGSRMAGREQTMRAHYVSTIVVFIFFAFLSISIFGRLGFCAMGFCTFYQL